MIALSPPRSSRDGDIDGENMREFPGVGVEDSHNQFIDFGDGNLLDCIDFDDLFIDIKGEGVGGLLPDLDIVDISEFSSSPVSGAEETSDVNASDVVDGAGNGAASANEEGDKSASEGDEPGKDSREPKGDGNSKSSSSKNNSPHGKKKAKVDWTPELHRKFVQAVEQLGLDKAVPSKILEIMGMKCLTRHNIASHLQKYRSHRKHLLAREAEAATWSHQRWMAYGVGKTDPSPWMITGGPIMGFPPPVMPRAVQSPFRPLHVWGHPSSDHSVWPKHHVHQLPQALPSRPAWPVAVGPPYSPIPPPAPSLAPGAYWHPLHHQVSTTVTPGTPCFPQARAFTGLMSAPPVPGIPPIEDPGIRVAAGQLGPQTPPDLYPSGESIDAAIGDALTKPWQPLPLGLKPPSLDGVLTELQRQGIPSVPPSSPS